MSSVSGKGSYPLKSTLLSSLSTGGIRTLVEINEEYGVAEALNDWMFDPDAAVPASIVFRRAPYYVWNLRR